MLTHQCLMWAQRVCVCVHHRLIELVLHFLCLCMEDWYSTAEMRLCRSPGKLAGHELLILHRAPAYDTHRCVIF